MSTSSDFEGDSRILDGRAVLVTGSTRGIGRAIAKTLINAGATVAIHGRELSKVEAVAEELRGELPADRVVPLAADLTDADAARALVKAVIQQVGRIDGLVNNAGGGTARAFRGIGLEGWRATQALNVESALCAMQEAYGFMRKKRAGSIVNMASLAAHGPGRWMGTQRTVTPPYARYAARAAHRSPWGPLASRRGWPLRRRMPRKTHMESVTRRSGPRR